MNPVKTAHTLDLVRRARRLRRTSGIRTYVRETRLSADQFLYPLFVTTGSGVRREVPSMPGVFQLSVDEAVRETEAARADGVPGVLLFGLPSKKDDIGSGAYDADAPVQSAVRAIKRSSPDTVVVTDVCLCEYTSHGHCGILEGHDVANDVTVDQLVRAAVSHAAAGADIVAPSDMMDGRVGAIRRALDERGFEGVAIMSYAAKYCSGFYGPFRDAADSAPQFGDRRTHQMDPANAEEALREVEQDIEEGADIVMVKPAMPYLDIVRRVKDTFGYPTAAYQVSGEYAMIKAAAARGWIDEPRIMMESLTSIARAGADIIITYYAREAARRALVAAANRIMALQISEALRRAPRRSSPAASTALSAPSRPSAARPCSFDSASGSHITDVDGRSYIDYVMSWGPLIHGHAPRSLVKALAAAARHGTSFGAPTELEVELGELVRSMMPSLERVRFVSSGTEATMSAVRVARAHTRREKIIKFEGCYHGHGDQFLVQAGSGLTTLGMPTSPGVTRAAAADTLLATYNDVASVERLCESFPDQIAALIVEPIAGNMGMVLPEPRFLQGLRDVCTRYRILLIFDEVITGFRVGTGGAQGWSGVVPDLTCLGKIIGGGLPVGAYGGREDLMRLVAPSGPVYQAGTLSGNPLAMTAGLWSLKRLSKGLYKQLTDLGAQLADGLADAARRRRRRAAGEWHRIGADAVLHISAGQKLSDGSALRRREIRRLLQGDARARRLSAAFAVRSVVPVGRAHRARRRQDHQGRARSDERGREARITGRAKRQRLCPLPRSSHASVH